MPGIIKKHCRLLCFVGQSFGGRKINCTTCTPGMEMARSQETMCRRKAPPPIPPNSMLTTGTPQDNAQPSGAVLFPCGKGVGLLLHVVSCISRALVNIEFGGRGGEQPTGTKFAKPNRGIRAPTGAVYLPSTVAGYGLTELGATRNRNKWGSKLAHISSSNLMLPRPCAVSPRNSCTQSPVLV